VAIRSQPDGPAEKRIEVAQMRTIIVVPCYNEANRLDPEAFERVLRTSDGVNFLFVDDGSTDQTARILESLIDRSSGLAMLHSLPNNKGKAEAVRSGVLEAFRFKPDYVGMWDADLAAPLSEIAGFVEILDKMPRILIVTGARVKMMGRVIKRSATRHYMGRLAASLISLALGRPYYDTQCGAKVFRATDLTQQLFAEPFMASWIFDVELLARLDALSRVHPDCNPSECVYELPLLEWRHKGGSKIRPSAYLFSLLDLWSIIRKYF